MPLIEERAEWRANRTYRTGETQSRRWTMVRRQCRDPRGRDRGFVEWKGAQRSRRTREKGDLRNAIIKR